MIEELIGEEILDESDIQRDVHHLHRRMSTAAVATRVGFHRQRSAILNFGREDIPSTTWGRGRKFQQLLSVPNVSQLISMQLFVASKAKVP